VPVLPVREVLRATPRTRIIRIELEDTAFAFTAGQAVLVGLQRSTVRKPYSIACSPRQARELKALELLVQIDDSGAPDPHLERATPGMALSVEGPFGVFGLPPGIEEDHVLFVAGGTGIAPLRAMLWDLLDRPAHTQLSLIYSARSTDEFGYEAELRQLADGGRLRLRQTVTREEPEGWTGPRGRVDGAMVQSMLVSPATRCVLCGPPGMVSTTSALLKAAGVPEGRILTETFVG
jgi:NAD(P)H-flavin reductase